MIYNKEYKEVLLPEKDIPTFIPHSYAVIFMKFGVKNRSLSSKNSTKPATRNANTPTYNSCRVVETSFPI